MLELFYVVFDRKMFRKAEFVKFKIADKCELPNPSSLDCHGVWIAAEFGFSPSTN